MLGHLGKVRGGWNLYARFHLHIRPASVTEEEMAAIMAGWKAAFTLKPAVIGRVDNTAEAVFSINTRREFALVPALIRRALEAGFNVLTSQWDVGLQGIVSLEENPAEFWKTLALAQAFFRDITSAV